MFHNKFRAQAVAATESRQQLDRLLRVTAPRERFVLVAVGLVLAVALGWLAFGSIARDATLDGVLLAGGGERRIQAVLRVDPQVARRVSAGMEATVGVPLPGGGRRRLDGVVGAVAAQESELRIDIELRSADGGAVEELDLPNGTPCQIRIVLARQSPSSLLLGRGPV